MYNLNTHLTSPNNTRGKVEKFYLSADSGSTLLLLLLLLVVLVTIVVFEETLQRYNM